MFILWEKEVQSYNSLMLFVRTKTASSMALLTKAILLENVKIHLQERQELWVQYGL